MKNALYDIVKVDEDKVFVIDLDLPGVRSVTNDAEYVWEEIQKIFPGKRLVYRDTMGRWDEMVCGPRGSIQSTKFFNVTFTPYFGTTPEI